MRKTPKCWIGLVAVCLVATQAQAQFVPIVRPVPTVPTVPTGVGGAYGTGRLGGMGSSSLGGINSISPLGSTLPELAPAPQLSPGVYQFDYPVSSANSPTAAAPSSPTYGGYASASQNQQETGPATHESNAPAVVEVLSDRDTADDYAAIKVVKPPGPPPEEEDDDDDDDEGLPWWLWLIVTAAAVMVVAKLND